MSSKDPTDTQEVITVAFYSKNGTRLLSGHVHQNGTYNLAERRAGRGTGKAVGEKWTLVYLLKADPQVKEQHCRNTSSTSNTSNRLWHEETSEGDCARFKVYCWVKCTSAFMITSPFSNAAKKTCTVAPSIDSIV